MFVRKRKNKNKSGVINVQVFDKSSASYKVLDTVRRIEVNIFISFVAFKVYKELERQLKEKKSELSPEAIEIAKTIFTIKIALPISLDVISQTLILNDEQKVLANLF